MFKKKLIFLKLIFISLVFVFFSLTFSYATEQDVNKVWDTSVRIHENLDPIAVPERDINLRINNLTRDCRVYLYLPVEMLRYNLEKFLNNNLENEFLVEAMEARDLKELLDKEDYLGYIDYFRQFGFKKESNEIELRHYSFCLDSVEILDYEEYNGKRYIKMKIFPNEDHEFKIITKDYFTNYNSNDIIFLVEEYGNLTYINLQDRGFTQNPEHPNISEINIDYDYQSKENDDDLEMKAQIAYWILDLILIIIALIIFILLVNSHKKKKEEIEARKFWKKKLTKEELKEEKKKKKEEKKALIKEIKAKKHKKK